MSWFDTQILKIRDDGAPAVAAVKNDRGEIITPAVEARDSWPEGHYVLVKHPVTAGDRAQIQEQCWKYYMSGNDSRKAEMRADFKAEMAAPVQVAVLLKGFEGENFYIDGVLPDVPTDFPGKLALVLRLPDEIVQHVSRRVDEDASPLAVSRNGKTSDSAIASGSRPKRSVSLVPGNG